MIGGSGRLRIQAVGQPCPRCGRDARVLDGFFDLLEDTVRLLDGPEFTKQVLADIFGAIEEVSANPAARDQVVARIAEKSPTLGAALQNLLMVSTAVASAFFAGFSVYLQLEESKRTSSIEERMLIISEQFVAKIAGSEGSGYGISPVALPQQEVVPQDNRRKRRADQAIKRKQKRH
jgi:hypothetical protein